MEPRVDFSFLFFVASVVPRLSPKPQTMNIIKSKIFRDASPATNFQHLECVKTKKWIKIPIYSTLRLKCLVKPTYVRGVSCVKQSDVQPHYFITLEREHVPGALHHRIQKLNPHLQMLHNKSPALCPPGLERLSFISQQW